MLNARSNPRMATHYEPFNSADETTRLMAYRKTVIFVPTSTEKYKACPANWSKW
jgi:hypothetical protein